MAKFIKYQPCEALKQYVKYFVVSENDGAASYTALPGTALVMGFQYKGSLSYLEGQEKKNLSHSGITGLQQQFRVFNTIANTGTILVYFKEVGAASFFKLPLHELFSYSISLDTFIPASIIDNTREELSLAKNDLERIRIVECFLLSQLRFRDTDLLVSEAIRQIGIAEGNMRIKQLAEMLHTSLSPFEKRFRKVVGASPKKFASIVRFRSLISLYDPNISLTTLAHQGGYYDQAHFINDFKFFTGETPNKFFNK